MSLNHKQAPNLVAGVKCLLLAVSALMLLVVVVAPARANAQDKKGKTTQTRKDTATDDKIYEVCEQMPIFEGGDAALMKYLTDSVKYPELAKKHGVQGRVVIGFIVEKDGSLTDVKVLRHVDIALDAEALRVIKGMPKWIPGCQDEQLVRVRYNVPVSFRLKPME